MTAINSVCLVLISERSSASYHSIVQISGGRTPRDLTRPRFSQPPNVKLGWLHDEVKDKTSAETACGHGHGHTLSVFDFNARDLQPVQDHGLSTVSLSGFRLEQVAGEAPCRKKRKKNIEEIQYRKLL